MKNRPKKTTPKTAPKKTGPKKTPPKKTAPKKTAPKKTAPKKTAPKKPAAAQAKHLSSPESTGHAGPFFEQHVDAAFLALLLVRGVAPFLMGAEVVEIH